MASCREELYGYDWLRLGMVPDEKGWRTRLGSLQQFNHIVFDRLRPDLVAGWAEVEQVRHDRFFEGTILGWCKMFRPDGFARPFPALSNGIAEENNLGIALRDNLQKLLMPGIVAIERLGSWVVR